MRIFLDLPRGDNFRPELNFEKKLFFWKKPRRTELLPRILTPFFWAIRDNSGQPRENWKKPSPDRIIALHFSDHFLGFEGPDRAGRRPAAKVWILALKPGRPARFGGSDRGCPARFGGYIGGLRGPKFVFKG